MKSSKRIPFGNRSVSLNKAGLLFLMAIPIIIITGFQGYWLRENYIKEKANLELKAAVAFRETVLGLQAHKLRIPLLQSDSINEFSLELKSSRQSNFDVKIDEGHELAGYINNVTAKIVDSISPKAGNKRGIRISTKLPEAHYWEDSAREIQISQMSTGGNKIVRFLYSVDSLQDSLHVAEIDSVFAHAIKKKKIEIPFTVHRNLIHLTKAGLNNDPMTVRVGLARPAVYQLKLGNSLPYILRQLTPAILFSVFLVGITFFSFVMLYRSLMQQRRLAEIKNDFISNITHELKTPIATVGVAIEALRNFNAISDPHRSKEYLDISQNELHRLSLLVDKVLKLSMFEKKEIELQIEQLNLREIVDEVVSSMKLQIEKHNAIVSVRTMGSVQFQGDRLHLLSVVFNLLDNALKYGNGNTKINIDLKGNENAVELVVADNGIGIPPEYKDKLFEKFFRVPAGDTHNAKGYGLGLSYVAHVIKKHNGRIEVESQPGVGTKFIITIQKTASLIMP